MAVLPLFDAEGRYILRETVTIWGPTPFGFPPTVTLGQLQVRIWPDAWAYRQGIVVGATLQWSHVMITETGALLRDGRDGIYGGLTLQPLSHWVQRAPEIAGTSFYRMVWAQTIYRGDGLRTQFRTLMIRLLGDADVTAP